MAWGNNNITEKDDTGFNGTFEMSRLDEILLIVDDVSLWVQIVSAILSVFANLLVIHAYRKLPQLPAKKILTLFLAVFDLAYGLSQVMWIHRRLYDHIWVFGGLLCKLTVISNFSIIASIYTILVIAIDRNRAIAHSFGVQFSKNKLCAMCVVISIIISLLQIPNMLRLEVLNQYGVDDCVRNWKPEKARYWDLFIFIVTYIIPIIILAICYGEIGLTVHSQGKNQTFLGRKTKQNHKKLVTILSLIIIGFFLSTTPNQIQIIWIGFADHSDENSKRTFIIFHALACLVHTHSFLNVIIYSICDPRFINVFLRKSRMKNNCSSEGTTEVTNTKSLKRGSVKKDSKSSFV